MCLSVKMANFGCCRTRAIPSYFICENCLNVFHKSCVLKQKDQFKFLKGHKILCCEKSIDQVDEISILEKTIGELTEEAKAKNKFLEKQSIEKSMLMEEALKAESELNELIDRHEKTIAETKAQIRKLEDYIYSIKNKPVTSTAVQTTSLRNCTVSSQTESEISKTTACTQTEINNSNIPGKIVEKITGTSVEKYRLSKSIPKLLIVSGPHGRNLSSILSRLSTDFVIEAIIKPNALDIELVNTAISNAKDFGKGDVVIIWTSKPHIKLLDEFIGKLKHTNPIVLTKPYMFSNSRNRNIGIYQDNLSFLKELHLRNIGKSHVFECNNVLRKSNYERNGSYINNTGKWYLAKAISSHIKNNFLKCSHIHDELKPIDFQQEMPSDYQYLYPKLHEMSLNEKDILVQPPTRYGQTISGNTDLITTTNNVEQEIKEASNKQMPDHDRRGGDCKPTHESTNRGSTSFLGEVTMITELT